MRRADEVAEQAVAVEVAREDRDAPTSEEAAASLPVAPRVVVDLVAQEAAVGGDVGLLVGGAEEAEEGVPARQVLRGRELQARQRHVGMVEVDGDDRGRIGGQVGERVAAARRDGDHAGAGRQLERLQVDVGILPDLRVDEPLEGESEESLAHACPRACPEAVHRRVQLVGASRRGAGGIGGGGALRCLTRRVCPH
jgi:hypothetical protein